MSADRVPVEVVFAMPEHQRLCRIDVPAGTTARAAIDISKLPEEFPGFDFSSCQLGVWGQPVDGGRLLVAGDRLEIYRPLQIDPREARRELAAQGRFMGSNKPD